MREGASTQVSVIGWVYQVQGTTVWARVSLLSADPPFLREPGRRVGVWGAGTQEGTAYERGSR